MRDKRYKPTEDEVDKIERAGIASAADAFAALARKDITTPEGVMTCLRAFEAAKQGYMDAVTSLAAEKNAGICHSPHVGRMAMAGLACHIHGMSPDDVSVWSDFVDKMHYFVQATIVLSSLSNAQMQFDECDDLMFGASMGDDAVAFANRSVSAFNMD